MEEIGAHSDSLGDYLLSKVDVKILEEIALVRNGFKDDI
jgi:hypothetical protein